MYHWMVNLPALSSKYQVWPPSVYSAQSRCAYCWGAPGGQEHFGQRSFSWDWASVLPYSRRHLSPKFGEKCRQNFPARPWWRCHYWWSAACSRIVPGK